MEPEVVSQTHSRSRKKPGRPRASLALAEVEPVSLKDRVINALKDAFLEGAVRPGEAIVEREVAKQMNVGTPVVREALIALQGEGFVRRVANKATYVTQFDAEEVRQLYTLRVELETLALQLARPRVTEADLDNLTRLIDELVEAAKRGSKREFLKLDYEFHRRYWKLSGNRFLAETLDRLMAPLFAFVVVASGAPLTEPMAREHYDLVNALRSLPEPDFSILVRKTLNGFAFRWIASMAHSKLPDLPVPEE